MRYNDPNVCRTVPRGQTAQALKVITLDNLLNRVKELKAFRKEIRKFLEGVHQRELVLKQMNLAVESIQSDTFFFTEADLEAKKAFATVQSDKSKLQAEANA